MSAVRTTPAPVVGPRGTSRRSLLRWGAGGASVAALLTAATIAVWPASAVDQARDDGERFGEAVSALYYADTEAEVDAALTDLSAAATDAREHAGDEVADQAAAQEDALARAADGFVGTHTSDDAFSVDLYQAELNDAVDDLATNAEEFRTQGPEVRQAFWDGVQDTVPTT